MLTDSYQKFATPNFLFFVRDLKKSLSPSLSLSGYAKLNEEQRETVF